MYPNTIRTIGSLLRDTRNVPADAIGIEIELEGFIGQAGRDVPRSWTMDRDGSLRNNGIEIKSRTPWPGDEVTRNLTGLQGWLDSCDPPLIPSERTSVHVHLNFLDNIEEEVVNFVLLYTAMEGILDTIAGDRIRNNYCLGVSEAFEDYQRIVRDIITQISSGGYWTVGHGMGGLRIGRVGRGAGDRDNNRYSALNLVRLREYGTVEVRIHEGTLDMDRIADWVTLLQCMKSAASDRAIFDVMETLSLPPEEAMQEVFGENVNMLTRRSGLPPDQLHDKFRKGYYRAVTFVHNPHMAPANIHHFIGDV